MQVGYPMQDPVRRPSRRPGSYPRRSSPRFNPARGPVRLPSRRLRPSVPQVPWRYLSPVEDIPNWMKGLRKVLPYYRAAETLLSLDRIADSWIHRNDYTYSGLEWGCFRGDLPWSGVNGLVAWKYYNSNLSNTCGLLQAYDHTGAPLPQLDGGSWKHYFSWPKGGQWIVEFNRLGGQIGPLSGVDQRMIVKGAWKPVHLIWYQGSSQAIPQEALDLGYPNEVSPVAVPVAKPVPVEVPIAPPYVVIPELKPTPWRVTGPQPFELPEPEPVPLPRPARPGRPTRERKTNSKMLGALLSVWHVATEFSDFVDSIYSAIDGAPKLRGDAAKIAYIANHLTDINPYAAIRNLLLNEVQDRLIGKMHRALDKAGVGVGFTGMPYLKQHLRN